ncbi:putative glycolipid-binding domain-containing protein [Actinomadura sp. 7K507]|uniref:putative glycolipid-binding domain-containing protein n=1 Tax=Actinomadura sp. 7K507 TaxID=2530365 RepID=UPI001A9D2872|nr:putative glycolipid-binding domain-containing protein [Actinomadura sp. 7K507]
MGLIPVKAPPSTAAWRHLAARDGFEVAYFQPGDDGHRIEGGTTAVEEGQSWIVTYLITLDAAWTTRNVQITGRAAAGSHRLVLEADGAGHWRVDGEDSRRR